AVDDGVVATVVDVVLVVDEVAVGVVVVEVEVVVAVVEVGVVDVVVEVVAAVVELVVVVVAMVVVVVPEHAAALCRTNSHSEVPSTPACSMRSPQSIAVPPPFTVNVAPVRERTSS